VLDVSDVGAKLIADIDVSIGSTFYLSAVPHALIRKRCKVVWRKKRMIGILFL
jgi:ABC-type uncharacterized transport system substrate-binding protein